MELFGYIMLGIIAIVSEVILNGLAVKILWGWFISPIFNLSLLSMAQAIGLAFFVNYMFAKRSNQNKKQIREEIAEILMWSIGFPLLSIAIGFILKLFM